jgi:hypothetical protein
MFLVMRAPRCLVIREGPRFRALRFIEKGMPQKTGKLPLEMDQIVFT